MIGYHVPKDTVIFVNNHHLNTSTELWEEPEKYNPNRFLDENSGDFTKPAHFQPFSMGKRACMGYKMVYNVAFSIISNLLSQFDICEPSTSIETIPLGMLALPPQPFEFILKHSAHSYFDDGIIACETRNLVSKKLRPKISPTRNVAWETKFKTVKKNCFFLTVQLKISLQISNSIFPFSHSDIQKKVWGCANAQNLYIEIWPQAHPEPDWYSMSISVNFRRSYTINFY